MSSQFALKFVATCADKTSSTFSPEPGRGLPSAPTPLPGSPSHGCCHSPTSKAPGYCPRYLHAQFLCRSYVLHQESVCLSVLVPFNSETASLHHARSIRLARTLLAVFCSAILPCASWPHHVASLLYYPKQHTRALTPTKVNLWQACARSWRRLIYRLFLQSSWTMQTVWPWPGRPSFW